MLFSWTVVLTEIIVHAERDQILQPRGLQFAKKLDWIGYDRFFKRISINLNGYINISGYINIWVAYIDVFNNSDE